MRYEKCVAFLCLSVSFCVSVSADVLPVGSRKQLFIDSKFVGPSSGVTLRMNPAQKLGPMLDMNGKPSNEKTGGYMKVIADGGKFKMYYSSFENDHNICYAESTDGFHWDKPDLGFGRQPVNMIPGMSLDATIMVDPHDVPERRYKMFRADWDNSGKDGHGVYGYYSADGIHFTLVGRMLPLRPEGNIIAEWDTRINKYVVWMRVLNRNGENQRQFARMEMDEILKPWPFKGTAPVDFWAEPSHWPVVLKADEHDDPHSDMYCSAISIYPWAQDVYLAFPAMFRHFSQTQQPWFRFEPGNDYGLMDVQMAVSRDGVSWKRDDRASYFPMGLPDEPDRWLVMMGTGMIRQGSWLYQYYWSTAHLHDGGILRPEYDKLVNVPARTYVLKQRLDGFMSLDFAYAGGNMQTPVISFDGKALELNVDTGAMGHLRVEIRDAENKPIKGFTLADCEEIGGNFVDTKVRWKGNSELTSLKGKPIRLYFDGRNAKLYAFQFMKE